MNQTTLAIGEQIEIGGKKVTVKGIGSRSIGGAKPIGTVDLVIEEPGEEADTAQEAGRFDSLGLSPRVTKLLNAADGEAFASVDALRAWLLEGNDLSDAVKGLGQKSEDQVRVALGVSE